MKIHMLPLFIISGFYIYGAREFANWVSDNVGSSPSSSFYGLLTMLLLMAMLVYFYRLLEDLIKQNDV